MTLKKIFGNKLVFVRDELSDIPEMKNLPKGNLVDFTSRIKYALSLGLKEKEIFFFGLLQWLFVILGYLLWVQMLFWIPQPVWDFVGECIDGPGDGDFCSLPADIPLYLWGVLCILLAAFPIGILSSAMGTAHFLHKNDEESTVLKCLNAAFSNAWATWNFHFVDGYITVNQILKRLPKKNDHTTIAERALSESLYYAWKVGVAGVIPSIVLGNGVIDSGKNSIRFVKANFAEVIKLRAAYSFVCWVVGILAYAGGILTIYYMGDSFYAPSGGIAVAKVYLYLIFPITLAVSIIMIFLRPIYVLTLCDMYSSFLASNNEKADLPNDPSKGKKAVIVFSIICLIASLIGSFRDQLGLTDVLSSIPEENHYLNRDGSYIKYNPDLKNYNECIQMDDGYKLGEKLSYHEYIKKLEDYCAKRFKN